MRGTTLPSSICTGAFNPALDVEQHPRTVRVLTDSLEHQLPIEAIEEALDVEIKHPVIAPTALTSRAHGIDRRFAGSVAIGVRLKPRLHNRLQIASGDLLSDAVSNRRNPQRSRPTIRPWNFDPPHRRRKVAP